MTKQGDKRKQVEQDIAQEVYCGILPVSGSERTYRFMDAFLILSGYCIATWSYTQGAYLTGLVGFRQLLVTAFAGALLMLLIYQLPVILATRYGIDIWIWLRAVFGVKGVKVVASVIILINFPWYAVCCDLFASSMQNLFTLFAVPLPEGSHLILELVCVGIGTLLALRGVKTITWTTRILVPALLAVGVLVMVIGFRAVPVQAIMDYRPVDLPFTRHTAYILAVEANFAFVITLVGGMAGVPRLCKGERSAYYAGVLGQGLTGSFFVVVGAVMAIAMQLRTGMQSVDPTEMLATLASPVLAWCSLLLVAFANIGTQAVGSYLYGVMLKSSFRRVPYRTLVMALGIYVSVLCVWGKTVEYFGSFLTVSACIYAPVAALLFVDFFVVRRQKLDFESAYELEGHHNYDYTGGWNLVGLVCLVVGCLMSLLVYNPVSGEIYHPVLFHMTPTGFSLLGTGIVYAVLNKLPPIRRYLNRDAAFHPDPVPFDSKRVPPRQNAFLLPFIWLGCYLITVSAGLRIHKKVRREGALVEADRRAAYKPPYLVLGTHHSFTDFYVTPLALFPHRANYVSELEGFEYFGEWIYRQIGCLGTRKFIDDFALIKNIRRVLERRDILVLYPEARYANVGTSSRLPVSVAKMVKLFRYPVVTLNMRGNYLQSPIWNLPKRKEARLEAEMVYALTREDIDEMTVEEIHDVISRLLTYDEYAWQRETGLSINYEKRAEGLHMPLYQCRCCRTEYRMQSSGSRLFCECCGAGWEMDEYGTLHQNGEDGQSIYIPEWYEWERENVKRELETGSYQLDCRVEVQALPNAVNFIDCGEGHLRHDSGGFELTFMNYRTHALDTLRCRNRAMGSVHTEYDYRGKGQCITLSTQEDTFFLFPVDGGFNATKIQFAVEEAARLYS